MAANGLNDTSSTHHNYVAYRDPKGPGQARIGSLDPESSVIQPLAYLSGAPISSLYEVIEIGDEQIKPLGETLSLRDVDLLPPIYGRDVLAVGKNYAEHAKEFNSSGYDSSDKVAQPSHPVIFTKRSTSIIASGQPIFSHQGFTESPDYEGEIGVIIGKSGFHIAEADAMDYVWGYTIINDMTARERQRDHKQFFIGKSPDTYCPVGPIAVPKEKLPKSLVIETRVNGQLKQKASIEDLIFSVPFLVKTLSEGQTLRPGDMIATGTPAGVGIGKTPPEFLKPGDVIEICVTGLGVLKNEMAEESVKNYTMDRVAQESVVPISNLNKTCGGQGLIAINGKQLYYRHVGDSGPPVLFIHGLGASSEFFGPHIASLGLEQSHSLHLLDIEGHGLSPTKATSVISIESYAEDFAALASHLKIREAMVIAHSMGCLIAETLALQHPELVKNLVLLGPPPSPLPEGARTGLIARAALVRSSGMAAVADSIVGADLSATTHSINPLAVAAVRMSLLGQDPEGYAKGCTALAGASKALPLWDIKARTLILTGDEDEISPPSLVEKLEKEMKDAKAVVLPRCGHWHIFESGAAVAAAVKEFL